jgi:hypothetical protein
MRGWQVDELSQRASYIGAIQADQTVESDHSDLWSSGEHACLDTCSYTNAMGSTRVV